MLHLAIAAGLVLGLIVGLGAAATGNDWLLAVAKGSAPFGTIFMNAIRMVVIPLIVTIIFTSIARLGDPRKLGRIGGLTIAYYWITLIPAIAIGMATMKVGLQYASEIEMPQTATATVPALQGIVDFIVSLVPANPFAAASNGAILPLIVFTALVAAATGTLPGERRERMINIADDASKALIKLVWWIMYVAPSGGSCTWHQSECSDWLRRSRPNSAGISCSPSVSLSSVSLWGSLFSSFSSRCHSFTSWLASVRFDI